MILAWLCYYDSLIALAVIAAGIISAHYRLTAPFFGFQLMLIGLIFAALALLCGLIALPMTFFSEKRRGALVFSGWQGWRFYKGVQHMDGHRALIYSRIRENRLNPADSDVTRALRQQQVMQTTLTKLASVSTFFRLPFSGGALLSPIATDLSTWQFLQLGWVKFRAGTTLHCRLGGKDLGDGYITGDQENISVIQMVLGNSAPQPPPPGSGPYGPGCVTGNQTFK